MLVLALLTLLFSSALLGRVNSPGSNDSASPEQLPNDRAVGGGDEPVADEVPTTTIVRPNTTRPAPRPIRVLIVGDSLVALGANQYRSALLEAGFEIVGYHAVSGTSMHDLLIGDGTGAWTERTIDELADAARDADVVYFSFGTNDHHPRRGRSNNAVLGDAIDLVAALDEGGQTCVIWQTWMSNLDHLPNSDEIDPQYQERLSDWWLATALLADQLNTLGADLAQDSELLGPDGIHLSAVGVAHNAAAMTSAIERCTT
ncbi:MAG: SGNH/GDSL hydrolase family protein [Acidimicrobiales bacterium]